MSTSDRRAGSPKSCCVTQSSVLVPTAASLSNGLLHLSGPVSLRGLCPASPSLTIDTRSGQLLKACLRLVSAVLNEISDEWLTGRTYLTSQASE